MSTRPPIEGDGIRVNFFNYLLRTPGEVAPPLRVPIPDTIVFEHNCPRSWYYYDAESKEIRKRAGRDLQAGTILAEFGQPNVTSSSGPPVTLSTVATFTYLRHDTPDGEEVAVTTLYLTRDTLEKLLISTSVIKMEGLLQRHLIPVEANECLVQATWGAKLCVVRRRMNCRVLTDRPRVLAAKHCTFDGPDHLSLEVATAKDTVADVTLVCERIAEHINKTVRMKPVSMLLYFKLDQQKRPRLLWCSSLRFEGHRFPDPPAARFITHDLEALDLSADDTLLEDCSEAQSKLERGFRGGGGHRSPQRSPSPNRAMSGTSTTMSLDQGSNKQSAAGASQALAANGSQRVVLPPDVATDIERVCGKWYSVNEDVDDECKRVREHQAAATQVVDDILYAVLSAHQQQDPTDTTIRFPAELTHYLGSDEAVKDLIRVVGLTPLPNGDLFIPSPKNPPSGSAPPSSIMIQVARDWMDQHFAKRLRPAMEKSTTHVQWAALKMALGRL